MTRRDAWGVQVADGYEVRWTEYTKYRARLRGFDLTTIEEILRHSTERYLDASSGRVVAVGRHGNHLVMVPYEGQGTSITAVTIHVTTRQQISSRLKSGRFTHE